MTWEDASAALVGLKVGAKLRKAAPYGEVHRWEVRGVLADDCVAVVRRWMPHRRGYSYDIMRPESLMVGLFVIESSRPGKKRARAGRGQPNPPARESSPFDINKA